MVRASDRAPPKRRWALCVSGRVWGVACGAQLITPTPVIACRQKDAGGDWHDPGVQSRSTVFGAVWHGHNDCVTWSGCHSRHRCKPSSSQNSQLCILHSQCSNGIRRCLAWPQRLRHMVGLLLTASVQTLFIAEFSIMHSPFSIEKLLTTPLPSVYDVRNRSSDLVGENKTYDTW